MSIERVVILHGFGASPGDHWFGWVADRLRAEGLDVHVPALPESGSPDRDVWTDAARHAIGEPGPSTAVVAHSLGAITALRALADTDGDIGAFVAVAGFVNPLPALPELDAFTRDPIDLKRLVPRLHRRSVVLSDNDSVVPTEMTIALGRYLQAGVVEVPGAGHFLAAEGVSTLPQVLPLLLG
ncbi:RBBP9/YdeN family alpha/beta hydrolase [Microbacterium sp. NPDC056052]|uniref:RBBP9/YdeN family alpha/beta hydrolase n=1 Tax=Microbacterium sp. NPDC056052 TaxID=3345695 RepID=UPI0035D602E0